MRADTELQQIVRDAALGTRLADKLIRVWRRDGGEQFVLIHVEIQGQRDPDFPKRMYVYNYRLFDRYDRRWSVWPSLPMPAHLASHAPRIQPLGLSGEPVFPW